MHVDGLQMVMDSARMLIDRVKEDVSAFEMLVERLAMRAARGPMDVYGVHGDVCARKIGVTAGGDSSAAEQGGHHLLEPVDGRVFALLLVSDLCLRHRAAHGRGGTSDGIAAEIDCGGGTHGVRRLEARG